MINNNLLLCLFTVRHYRCTRREYWRQNRSAPEAKSKHVLPIERGVKHNNTRV